MLQKWAHAYRDSVYIPCWRQYKQQHRSSEQALQVQLPHNKQRATVTAITTVLVEDYLPIAYQRYLLQNYKQISMHVPNLQ